MISRTLLRKISKNTNSPELILAIIAPDKHPLPDHCIVWTGACILDKPYLRKFRDYNNTPYLSTVMQKARGKIVVRGKQVYVQRLIYQLMHPDTPPFTSSQICTTRLCVNPLHWVFTASAPPDPVPEIPPTGDWTREEAQELLDMYLADHSGPVDFDHNLLVDIPRPLLEEILAK